jgi:hypothetical protein
MEMDKINKEYNLPFNKIADSYHDFEKYAFTFFKDNKLSIIEAEETLEILKANLQHQVCSGEF